MTSDKPPMTHLTSSGEARMVDVGSKAVTERTAVARAVVTATPMTVEAIRDNTVGKGDVLAVARVAGIMAAKRTSQLIPLCHPISLSSAEVAIELVGDSEIEVTATARTAAQTGVEMEALTAVSVAALTIYDMCKSIDRGMTITDVRLMSKAGGKSGEWTRETLGLKP